MKNVKMTICLVIAVLVIAAGQGFGLTDFNDGATHNINYTINDNVQVDFVTPGLHTTFNLLNGGTIPSPYQLDGNLTARINISGGSVNRLVSHGQITISAGTVGSLYASNVYNTNTVTMTGGRVNYLNDGIGTITISGGSIGNLGVDGDGGVKVGQVIISGSNFAVNGNHVNYGEYFHNNFYSGRLTGILANGDALDTQFSIDYAASITLIPEPTTICLFGLAGLFLRRRK
jgi:hypothetical protein